MSLSENLDCTPDLMKVFRSLISSPFVQQLRLTSGQMVRFCWEGAGRPVRLKDLRSSGLQTGPVAFEEVAFEVAVELALDVVFVELVELDEV